MRFEDATLAVLDCLLSRFFWRLTMVAMPFACRIVQNGIMLLMIALSVCFLVNLTNKGRALTEVLWQSCMLGLCGVALSARILLYSFLLFFPLVLKTPIPTTENNTTTTKTTRTNNIKNQHQEVLRGFTNQHQH